MPKLYQKNNGTYYTKTLNKSGNVVTLQIDDEGAEWLRNVGFDIEQELGTAFWELYENDRLYTLGEVSGGGELDIPTNWIQHEALATHPFEMEPVSDEPLTIPTDSEFANAPRFLFAPNTSIYYTILSVENSSDQWLEVPLLIKNYGAMELLRLGADVDEEFTEEGLRLLFERRWCYFDEERFPN